MLICVSKDVFGCVCVCVLVLFSPRKLCFLCFVATAELKSPDE